MGHQLQAWGGSEEGEKIGKEEWLDEGEGGLSNPILKIHEK